MKRLSILFFSVALAFGSERVPDSALADAAERRDSAAIQALLANEDGINGAQPDGMTALHWAVWHDDLQTARLLLRAGADATLETPYKITPLTLAAENGNSELVRLLLAAGADANTTLPGGESVLMTAARTGDLSSVKLLLEAGADVQARDRRGQTAIMWAAAEGHAAAVSRLIEAGGDFATPLESGFNAFFFAVREGRREVVSLLIEKGFDLKAIMEPRHTGGRNARRGTSGLMLAIENGHFELAADLLQAGADPSDERSGFSPLHALTWVRKPVLGEDVNGEPPPIGSGALSSLGLARKLVEAGADVNARLKRGKTGRAELNLDGATPFLMAAWTCDLPYMRLLLELGADPLLPNADNCTPLMAAAGIGVLAPGEEPGNEAQAIETIEFLLSLGADINSVDRNGETVMHGAAYKGAPRIVRLFAERGAKIEVWNKENRHGWSPLEIAEGYRPGNFRPSAATIAAFHSAMLAEGITPPVTNEKKQAAY